MRAAALLTAASLLGCAGAATTATTPASTTGDASKTKTRSEPMGNEAMLRMPLDVKGTGAPLVLVGGGLTGWASWEPHQARLASTRTVGRAQPLAVAYGLEDERLPSGYSIDTESRALGAAIDARFPSGPIDLTGWSYGAFISLTFALDHPERIRTLTLVEPPAFWVLDATGVGDAESARESDAMRALYETMTGDVTEQQLATFVCQAGLCPPGKSPTELPQWPAWVKHRRSLRTGGAAWGHTDSAARLRGFDRPVLLVKGTGSSHFLHRIVDGLAATLPHARTIELPGGHAPNVVSMDAFLQAMASFQGAAP
jgi:pimeloyl-ACP methyl ester carboxylesterase